MSADLSSSAPDSSAISPAALDQAVAWFVRLASGQAGAGDHDALAQWRQADPEHERAWQRVQGVEHKLRGGIERVQAPVARAALSGAAASSGRRRALKTLAVAGAVGTAALWTRQQGLWTQWTADYSSGVGERRSVVLADGTQVLLNTDTALDVHFDAGQRRLSLRSGEVRVVTAADPAGRPFLVSTRDGSLRPIGTRFTVRRLDGDSTTRLSVSEGAVEVRCADGGPPVLVQAGQQTRFSGTAIQAPAPLDDAATSWTDGVLTAERMRLDDFLAELSRYRPGRLRCDPAVAGLRLTGAYPLNDTDRILAALQQTLPVQVHRYTRYWVTVSAR